MDTITKIKNLLIIYSITLMAVLGLATTTPAFPGIAESLNVPQERIGWILTAFVLPGIIFTPVFGVLADRYGRKQVLVPALFLFSIAGGMVGFARDFDLLIGLTFLQGIGAASLGALNVTLIGDMFKERRTAVMGYNNGVMSIGTALYPVIGGTLASIAWYYPFFLPFAGLPVAFFVWFGLDNPQSNERKTISDYFNTISRLFINQPRIISFFTISFFTYIILFGVFLNYLPFVIKDKFDGTPEQIGYILATMSGTTVISSFLLGKLSKKYNNKAILSSAFVFYTVAVLLMINVSSYSLLFIPAVLYGIAQGINQPNIQSMIAGLAPDTNRAIFMSINRMVVQGGQALGPALMGYIYVFYNLEGVFYLGAIIAGIMLLFAFLFIKN